LGVFKTIYLTGAPASGKTAVARSLLELIPDIALWGYGDQLLRHIAKKGVKQTHDSLRLHSSTIITPNDISEVDELLIRFITEHIRHMDGFGLQLR
jgi:adenylate kinase